MGAVHFQHVSPFRLIHQSVTVAFIWSAAWCWAGLIVWDLSVRANTGNSSVWSPLNRGGFCSIPLTSDVGNRSWAWCHPHVDCVSVQQVGKQRRMPPWKPLLCLITTHYTVFCTPEQHWTVGQYRVYDWLNETQKTEVLAHHNSIQLQFRGPQTKCLISVHDLLFLTVTTCKKVKKKVHL